MIKQVAVIALVGFLLFLMAGETKYMVVVLTISSFGLVFARFLSQCVPPWPSSSTCVFFLLVVLFPSRWVLAKDDGTPEMRKVSDPIREGAEGFLRVQYTAISKFAVFVAVGIFMSYKLRPVSPNPKGVELLGSNILGFIGAVSFLLVRWCVCVCCCAVALCACPCAYVYTSALGVFAHAVCRVCACLCVCSLRAPCVPRLRVTSACGCLRKPTSE